MSKNNSTRTNAIFNLNYVFEPRWGDARFDKGDVLQLSDLQEEVKVNIFFADNNGVLLGRAPSVAADGNEKEEVEAATTISTISPELRRRMLSMTVPTEEEKERTELLRNADLPLIDLQPFGADVLGISRKHAVLQWDMRYITLTDLNSTNGTCINGSSLYPMQRRVVRNGDELQLGGIQLRVRYRRPESEE